MPIDAGTVRKIAALARLAVAPEDEERPCDVREEALAQAPDREGDYFRVPRVV